MNSKTSKSSNQKAAASDGSDYMEDLDYKALFRIMPERYIIFRANDPDFTFVDVSDSHATMVNASRDSIIGQNFFDRFPDTSEEFKLTGDSALLRMFREIIKTKQPKTLEAFRYDIPNGRGGFTEKYWRPVHYPILDKRGEVAYLLQSSQDVTEDYAKTIRLDDMQAQLDEALEIGQIGRWFWNVQRNVVVANAIMCDLFGIPYSQGLQGQPIQLFLQAIHPDDIPAVNDKIQTAMRDRTSYEAEYRTIDRDGRIRWLITRGRVELDNNGNILRFPGVAVDITDRQELLAAVEASRAREELKVTEAELLQVRNEELENISRAKDEFVALASHQLRTPATAVKQYLGMVLQGYIGDVTDAQTEMLEKAFESNERQIQIINQILNTARVDNGRLVLVSVPVDIKTMVEGIVEDLRGTADRKQQKLSVTYETKSATVDGDNGYLRMAIENIVHNASVYTPEGGTVAVSVRVSNGYVKIAVSDTGVGIKKADIPKLFEKFTRIHNSLSVAAGGTGIGLYLAAEIVRLHDGTIDVQSKIHKGTTFTINLPLVHNHTKAKHKTD